MKRRTLGSTTVAPLAAIAATLLVFSLAGCAPATSTAEESQYVAVIDAGSSGSRIFLYQGEVTASSVNVETLLEFEPDEGDGLSSYEATPNLAGDEGVGPLLTELKTYLAAHDIAHADVPIYVMATAGMRDVELTDAAASAAIYASVSKTIAAGGFTAPEVGTISGTREALYAWTDVNYTEGLFNGTTAVPTGIVEVGGASSQVAFTTTSTGPNVTPISLAGKDYRVFGVSYLGMGQNDARRAILAPEDAVDGNVCFPNNEPAAEPAAYDIKNPVAVNAGESSFDFAACQSQYGAYLATEASSAVNVKTTSNMLPSAVADIPGFAETKFVGLGALNFTLADFDISPTANEKTALTDGITSLCSGPNAWAAVMESFGKKISEFSANACANATYNETWAFTTFGLNVNPDRFSGLSQDGREPLTWTRGAAVLLLSGETGAVR